MTDYIGGDILFYVIGANPDLYDKAIVGVTGSKFVHVAVAINHVQKIEAISGGIMLNYLNNRQVDAYWRFNTVDTIKLHTALNWLMMQKGNAYSWSDAANILLDYLHSPIELAESNQVFCSGLAAEFIQKCGYVLVDPSGIYDPHKISPGKLAAMLGVK
jgi:hypothetical protein